MNSWKESVIKPAATIRDAIKVINKAGLQIALVVNDQFRLVGIVTDGDIRRGVLKGIDLDQPVELIMNKDPKSAKVSQSRQELLSYMRSYKIHHIPLVDQDKTLVGLETFDELVTVAKKPNMVVLMAGGKGKRLGDLTRECPKPLLNVGTQPIMQTIIENFLSYGFCKFKISVNYKSHMIENYFGDGEQIGAEIEYIHEQKRLGTAGALSLMEQLPDEPFFVMNADILTKVNFQAMLDYHRLNNGIATMAVREYDMEVPYGVVDVEDNRVSKLVEKPVHRFFVNAGIYVLEPECVQYIDKNEFFDMTTLFSKLIAENKSTISFPVHEYWLDIGRISEYDEANVNYERIQNDE